MTFSRAGATAIDFLRLGAGFALAFADVAGARGFLDAAGLLTEAFLGGADGVASPSSSTVAAALKRMEKQLHLHLLKKLQ